MKTLKEFVHAKLTSLYGNGSKESNPNFKFSKDCVVIEKNYLSYNYLQNHSISAITKADEEEGAYGVSLKNKRLHWESSSPRIENVKSPSWCEEADVDALVKGFFTARAKLI